MNGTKDKGMSEKKFDGTDNKPSLGATVSDPI